VSPPTRRAFARALAGHEPATLAGLLVDLRTAAGDEAHRDGARAVVGGVEHLAWAGGPSARLLDRPGLARLAARRAERALARAGADRLLVPHPRVAAALDARGVSVVGPADLRRRLLYGVDRATADRIALARLGRPVAGLAAAGPVGRVRAPVVAALERLPVERPGAALAGLFAVALVVAAVGAAAVPVPGAGSGAADPAADGPAGAGEPTVDARTETARQRSGAVPGTPAIPATETVAPGVTGAGVTDPAALAAAHADALDGRAHGWQAVYREYEPERVGAPAELQGESVGPAALRRETVRFDRATGIRTELDGRGALRSTQAPFVRPGDGRTPTGAYGSRLREAAPADDRAALRVVREAARAGLYVASYLDGRESRIVGRTRQRGPETSETLYSLRVSGHDATAVRAYRAEAVVSATGFVRELRAEFLVRGAGVRVVVTVRSRRASEAGYLPPTGGAADEAVDAGASNATAQAAASTRSQ
jgi:hypothetical protein